MQTIRSDYIVHWTGKDIDCKHSFDGIWGICDEQQREAGRERREAYIERLRGTLYAEREPDTDEPLGGLWMTEHDEKLAVWPILVRNHHRATCFTELRLSQVHEHARKYGHLGLGFSRKFIADRFGSPVLYARYGDSASTPGSLAVGNLIAVIRQLQHLNERDGNRIDASFKKEYKPPHTLRDMVSVLYTAMGFMRSMSDHADREDLQYEMMDELEWRVLRSHTLVDNNLAIDTDPPGPPSKLRFRAADLRAIVFPDADTRRDALHDPDIDAWLPKDPAERPLMPTVEECSHF